MVKVSVIVPVYEVPLNFLRECFDSLLAQTMQECEFIVVSDGAPEAECAVCEEYAIKDSRFNFLRIEHAGVSAARNFGLEFATGEYITFVDSDDWIDCSTLTESYEIAKIENSEIVFWNFSFHKENGSLEKKTIYKKNNTPFLNENDRNEYLERIIWPKENHFLAPALTFCKLISRNKISLIRFDPDLRIGEDRVFNISIAQKATRISYLNKCFYHYRKRSLSAIQTVKPHLFNDYLAYIKKIEAIANANHTVAISNETICSFYGCIAKMFFSNLSLKEKIDELLFLKSFIKQNEFCQKIQACNTSLGKFSFGIEIFLMKHKISWLFSLRILKYRLLWLKERKH